MVVVVRTLLLEKEESLQIIGWLLAPILPPWNIKTLILLSGNIWERAERQVLAQLLLLSEAVARSGN